MGERNKPIEGTRRCPLLGGLSTAHFLSENKVFVGAGLTEPSFTRITRRQPDGPYCLALLAGPNKQAFSRLGVPETIDEAEFFRVHGALL